MFVCCFSWVGLPDIVHGQTLDCVKVYGSLLMLPMWRLSMSLHNSFIAKTNQCFDLAKAKKATDGKKKICLNPVEQSNFRLSKFETNTCRPKTNTVECRLCLHTNVPIMERAMPKQLAALNV